MIKAKKTNAKSAVVQATVQALEKTFRQSKKAIWLDLANRLSRPSRQRSRVNVWKLNKLASQLPGKTLVVAGYVLGFGQATAKINVVALAYSADAKKKIGPGAQTFLETLSKKNDATNWVIVA